MNEPVKKKSKAVWIGTGIGCLSLLCIAVIIGGALIYFISNNPAKEASRLLSEGDSKYNAATKSIEDLNPIVENISKGKSDDNVTKLAAQSAQIVTEADRDLESAKSSYEKINKLDVSSEIKEKGSLSLESTEELQEGIKQYGVWIEDSSKKLDFLEKFISAYKKSHIARKELYTAINANNNDNRDRTLLFAQKAQIYYKEAKTLSNKANEIMKDPSNEALIKSDIYMSKCADYAIELGKIGRTGNAAKYNAARDKYEKNRKLGQALFSKIVLIDKQDEWIQKNITAGTKETLDLINSAEKKKQEADKIEIN